MQHANHTPPSYTEAEGLSPEADETETVVVLEWAVPTAAKVPAAHQHLPIAITMLRPASITSTVPASIILELRANNTVLPIRWCTTATLTAAPLAARLGR